MRKITTVVMLLLISQQPISSKDKPCKCGWNDIRETYDKIPRDCYSKCDFYPDFWKQILKDVITLNIKDLLNVAEVGFLDVFYNGYIEKNIPRFQ